MISVHEAIRITQQTTSYREKILREIEDGIVARCKDGHRTYSHDFKRDTAQGVIEYCKTELVIHQFDVHNTNDSNRIEIKW